MDAQTFGERVAGNGDSITETLGVPSEPVPFTA